MRGGPQASGPNKAFVRLDEQSSTDGKYESRETSRSDRSGVNGVSATSDEQNGDNDDLELGTLGVRRDIYVKRQQRS